jgi:hypothetical protein
LLLIFSTALIAPSCRARMVESAFEASIREKQFDTVTDADFQTVADRGFKSLRFSAKVVLTRQQIEDLKVSIAVGGGRLNGSRVKASSQALRRSSRGEPVESNRR